PVDLAVRPTGFERQVAAVREAPFVQTLAKRRFERRERFGPSADKSSDHRLRRLLRARGKRPCGRTAEQGDDGAAAHHSITSSARASNVAGAVRPNTFAVLRLITSSYLVGACTGRSAGFSPLRMRSTYPAARRY